MKAKPAATATTMRPTRTTMPAAARSSPDAAADLDQPQQLAAAVAELRRRIDAIESLPQMQGGTGVRPPQQDVPPANAALAARIVGVETAIRDLRRDIDAVRAAQSPPLDDRAWLSIIDASTQGHVFTVPELRHHAAVDDDLRRALVGMNARQIGNRLRRLHRHPVSGFSIDRVDRDEFGCMWRLIHADAGRDDDDGAQ